MKRKPKVGSGIVPVPQTVAEYFDKIPREHRATLTRLRKTIRSMVPKAEEVISYGLPTLKVGQTLSEGR